MSSLLTLAGNAAPTGFYDFPIEQSLRFNDDDSAYLSRTPASAGNRRTWTWSGWVKRGGAFTSNQSLFSTATNYDDLRFSTNGELLFVGGTSGCTIATTSVYRDPSAWMSIILSYNSTEATSSDRVKIYVNGEQVTSLTTAIYPALNRELDFNNTVAHAIGRRESTDNLYADLYLADVNFIDGQALDPTSFGEFKSGIFIPKDTSGLTFGTMGFRLQFGDSAAIGDDTSGNTNDWTANNLVASDVVLDSPTNNFAVLSLSRPPASSGATLAEGNLKYTTGTTGGSNDQDRTFVSSILTPTTGKWYAEYYATNANMTVQVNAYQGDQITGTNTNRIGLINTGIVFETRTTGTPVSAAYGGTFTTGDVIQVYVDMDNSPPRVAFGKGGLWGDGSGSWNQSVPTSFREMGSDFLTDSTSNNGQVAFSGVSIGGASNASGVANFGQDSTFAGAVSSGGNTDANGLGDFKYTVPDEALALCTANLPSGAIDTLNDETPEDYFNTVLYSGNSTNNTPITVGFQPSMTWIKTRNVARDHRLMDAVRGATAGIYPNLTNAEGGSPLISFDTDGFTLNNTDNYNNSGETYASWNWKAGGSGVSNTDGSITSTVSVGATSQQNWFSIVKYTGTGANATVGHGLDGTVPEMIIAKRRNTTGSWGVYHSGMTSATYQMWLNLTNGETSRPAQWNSTAPTSSVFSIGTDTDVNASGSDYIAYCFANAEGLCKVGKYTGNGSTDGTFVFTGHRPAFLITKHISSGNWAMWDNKRDPENVVDNLLYPNLSHAQNTGTDRFDFLSNGFKCKNINDANAWNASGVEYLFLSIAEQPFKFANAR